MAQTTNAYTMKDAKVEVSSNGTTYTDISGFANEVTVSGGERMSGEVYTVDGDTALVGIGKRQPVDIAVSVVYTEGTGDPFETLRAAYEAGSTYYVRWSPRGGQTGEFQFTASGPVTAFEYPDGEAGSGDPITVSFTVRAAGITKSTVA